MSSPTDDPPVEKGVEKGVGVARNAGWLFASDLVSKVAGLVLVVVIARSLGQAEYGYFAFAIAFAPLFLQLARWGVDIETIRRISADHSQLSPVFVNGVVVRTALALAALAASLAITPLLVPGRAVLPVALVSCALFFDELSTYATAVFTAFERMRFNAVNVIVNRIVSTGAAWVAVALGGGLVAVSLTYLIGSLVATVIAFGLLFSRFPRVRASDLNTAAMRDMVKGGSPYGIAAFLNAAVFKADTVLLQAIKGAVSVAVYGIAFRFFEPLIVAAWILAHAAMPRMVKEAEAPGFETNEAPRTFDAVLLAMLAIYLPVAAGAPFVANWLIELLFTERYDAAVTATIWLTTATVFYSVAHLCRIASLSIGERAPIAKVAAVVLGFNLALNAVAIPVWGASGAAAATVFTEVVEAVLLLRVYQRRAGRVRVGRIVLAPLLASGLMAAVLAGLDLRGPAALGVGIIVYGTALVGLSLAIDRRRVQALLQLAR